MIIGKKYKPTKEHRENLRKSHLGKFPSKENLNKRSKTMLARNDKERKNKISIKLKGHKVSEETRRKISIANKRNPSNLYGRPQTNEAKEKIRQANMGKKHTKETKEKIRLARAKQITPKKDTSIEIKIQEFLKKLGITFLTHQHIKDIEHSYQCDILIPSMNLVIECDGDYWHKYPIGREIDHIRTSELIQKGFRVLRLWEYEIKEMDLNQFKIKLNPELLEI